MKMYAPHPMVFVIALVLVLIGLLSHVGIGPSMGVRNVSEDLSVLGFLLLLLGTISESFQKLYDNPLGGK